MELSFMIGLQNDSSTLTVHRTAAYSKSNPIPGKFTRTKMIILNDSWAASVDLSFLWL